MGHNCLVLSALILPARNHFANLSSWMISSQRIVRRFGTGEAGRKVKDKGPVIYSISSSFSATALICANTCCPGVKRRLASDFLVMLATSGAPMSKSTSTED